MSTLTIRLPDDKHERLKLLAKQRHISMLAEFDTEMRFRARAAKGSPKEGLKLLEQLDKHFKEKE